MRSPPVHCASHKCIGHCADFRALPVAMLPTRVPILVTALLRSPPSPRPSLPRAVHSAPPATQLPWRLRSAGFPSVDLPIFHTARIDYLTARGGLGFHTRRSRLLGCAMAPLVIPFWGLSGSNGGPVGVGPSVCSGKGFLSRCNHLDFSNASSRSIRGIHQSIPPFCLVIGNQRPFHTSRWPSIPVPEPGASDSHRSLPLPRIWFRFRPGSAIAPDRQPI